MDLIKTVQDSVTPEEDHSVERLDAQSKETIQHIANNSSRSFFWKEVAQYALTSMAIFGGMAIGGGAVISGATALMLAGGSGLVGLVSSVIAHKIELKNEISLEELYAKRTGKYVADSIEEKSQALDKVLQTHPVPDLPLPQMPYEQELHASRRFQAHEESEPAATMPDTRIGGEKLVETQIQVPSDRILH